MKDLTNAFLSPEEAQRVTAAVAAAEKETAGEIVAMVVSESYRYPAADMLGGAALALPAAVLLTPLVGEALWIGPANMWLLLGIFAPLYLLMQAVVRRTPRLKRLFIVEADIDEEVEEAAIKQFYLRGLYRTRDETGVLLFISVFERKVRLLADRGISGKLPEETWQDIVAELTAGIRQRRRADAICHAIARIGRILADHFPVRPDDADELDNLIIGE